MPTSPTWVVISGISCQGLLIIYRNNAFFEISSGIGIGLADFLIGKLVWAAVPRQIVTQGCWGCGTMICGVVALRILKVLLQWRLDPRFNSSCLHCAYSRSAMLRAPDCYNAATKVSSWRFTPCEAAIHPAYDCSVSLFTHLAQISN